jgi:hypothetical protein
LDVSPGEVFTKFSKLSKEFCCEKQHIEAKKKIALKSDRNDIGTQITGIALQLRQGRQEFLFKKGIKPTSTSGEIKTLKWILRNYQVAYKRKIR